MQALQPFAAFVARLLLALIFLIEGAFKIPSYGLVVGYMEGFGVPGTLLPLVIAVELGGGVLIAAGLFTRLAAFALAGFCLLSAFVFHLDLSDTNEFIHLLKNIAMAGGFLALVAFGPGALSLDARLRASGD